MGRASVKNNKNPYHLCREQLGLSRERASELTNLSPERIEKIENERTLARPDEILAMSRGYKAPALCNHYCSNDCEIGRAYVPEVKSDNLPQIILTMVASLNSVQKSQNRLIEIASDGLINDDEIPDFIRIQQRLEDISQSVEALQLWFENMILNGQVNQDEYARCIKELRKK